MKFAKILFFIAVIGFSLSYERKSVRSGTAYTEMTISSRVAVGYKDMLTPPSSDYNEKVLEKNYKVQVVYKNRKANQLQIQATIIKEGSFRSGIPLYSDDSGQFETPRFSEFLLLKEGSDNLQYIPFVQLSGICTFDIAIKPLQMNCPIKNKSGTSMVVLEFQDSEDLEANTLVNQINKLKNERITEINAKVLDVLDAIQRLKAKQQELKNVGKSIGDANKKRDEKQKAIRVLQDAQNALDDQLTAEKNKYGTLTANVEAIQKRINDINQKIREAQNQISSSKGSLTTLRGQMTPDSLIKKLEADSQLYLTRFKYWVQGAVYHRIIDDGEARPLEDLVVNSNIQAFRDRLDDYFFPQ